MNILFTSDLSGIGGGETSLINLCEEIKKERNHNIYVLCAAHGKLVEILKSKHIPVFVINYRSKITLFYNLFKIRKLVSTLRIDVIHNNDPITSIIMRFAVIGDNVGNFWTCHGQWYKFSFFKKYLIKKSINHIFCVSSKVMNVLNNMGIYNTSKTGLGIPLKKYKYAFPSNYREIFHINSDFILFACIARFQPIKGQLKLVKALEKVISETKSVCFFVGGCVFGNKIEKEYYNQVLDYVKDHSLDKHIFFLGELDNIPCVLKEIDCLLIPSDNESFGMVAIEALASGTTVLSTPNDGVSEILDYDPNFIAYENSEFGLYKLMSTYINQKNKYDHFKQQLEIKSENYSIQKISKKYLQIFADYVNYS